MDGVRDDGLVVARRLQPRAGRGVHGTDRVRRRPRHRRRLRQHADQGAAPAASASAATLAYGSGDQRPCRRPTSTQPLARGDPDSWLAASRPCASTRCGRTAACPAATRSSRRARRSRRRSRFGLGTPTRVDRRRRSSCGRTTCPTTAFPARPGRTSRWRRRRSDAATRSIRANYYGSPGVRLRQRRAGQRTRARVEHDVNRRLTLRNQTRYNRAHRDAGHHHDPEPGGLRRRPRTVVAIARQGNDARERDRLEPDEPDRAVCRPARSVTRPASALEFTHEAQFAPTLDRHRHAGARRASTIPNPNDPVTGYAPARPGRSRDGNTNTVAAVCLRHGRHRAARWQFNGGVALGALRHRLSSRSDAAGVVDGRSSTTTMRWSAARPACSIELTDAATSTSSYGTTCDAAGHGELHAERAAEQCRTTPTSIRRSRQLRGRQQVGLARRPAVADRRGVPDRATRTSSSRSTRPPFRRSSTRTTRSG